MQRVGNGGIESRLAEVRSKARPARSFCFPVFPSCRPGGGIGVRTNGVRAAENGIIVMPVDAGYILIARRITAAGVAQARVAVAAAFGNKNKRGQMVCRKGRTQIVGDKRID